MEFENRLESLKELCPDKCDHCKEILSVIREDEQSATF
jgi:hypothetical protein